MITVPVIADWNHSKVIETLTVDERQLPPGENWHLSIGYEVIESKADVFTKIKLICVSPKFNRKYCEIL